MVRGVTAVDVNHAICNVGVEKESFGQDQNTEVRLHASQCVKMNCFSKIRTTDSWNSIVWCGSERFWM